MEIKKRTVKSYPIVVGILKFGEKILFLKRTSNREVSPDKWQTVSGFIKEKEDAESAVLREIKEETGLEGKIIKIGKVFEITDSYGRWIVIPFLVSVNSNKVKIDPEEHEEYKWISPDEINKLDCITGTKEDLESVGI